MALSGEIDCSDCFGTLGPGAGRWQVRDGPWFLPTQWPESQKKSFLGAKKTATKHTSSRDFYNIKIVVAFFLKLDYSL